MEARRTGYHGEFRYQTITLLVSTLFVEPLLRVLLAQLAATATVSKFLPGAAGEAIAGSSLCVSSGMANLLQPSVGMLVLLAYAVVLAPCAS